MGFSDLTTQNVALLLRWWWRIYTSPNSIWSQFSKLIYGRRATTTGPRVWVLRGSYFWNQLQKIRPFFVWSVEWEIGDGNSISFWSDIWECNQQILPVPSPNPHISLRQAKAVRGLVPDYYRVLIPALEIGKHDTLRWKWSSGGNGHQVGNTRLSPSMQLIWEVAKRVGDSRRFGNAKSRLQSRFLFS